MTRLEVDDLEFEVRLSDRRKTLQVTVDRAGELVLAAPRGADETKLRDFVRSKALLDLQETGRKRAAPTTNPPKGVRQRRRISLSGPQLPVKELLKRRTSR